jgi:hypothetical protein
MNNCETPVFKLVAIRYPVIFKKRKEVKYLSTSFTELKPWDNQTEEIV